MRGVALATALLAGCATPRAVAGGESRPEVPYVLLLGTAQDAGLPQIGCERAHCTAARRDPTLRRRVTSLLLVDPVSGERWLFDATPDLREQYELARTHPPTRELPGTRPPLFDGVFLTHAHMGHYGGLLQFGKEAHGWGGLRLLVSERMDRFLASNGPWDEIHDGAEVVVLRDGEPLRLNERLTVTPLAVPHRAEYTDTFAFVIAGPSRSLLYLPDIDKWERWETRIEDVLARVDVALLDAAFYGPGEVPGLDLSKVPHPFGVESLARFASLPASERAKIRFTHMNHSNPMVDPTSEATWAVLAAGHGIARDGEVHVLDRLAESRP